MSAAYVAAGYSKTGARSNGTRLVANESVSARISELKTAMAQGVVNAEIRRRSWRVQQLQALANDMLALRAARKALYGNQLEESHEFEVNTVAEEQAALAEGCHERKVTLSSSAADAGSAAPKPAYPKTMVHPGYPNGSSTGLLVKDYRGHNAEREIWKFDAGLVARFNETLKQAAIEEGQWNEKREKSGEVSTEEIKQRLEAGRERVAAAKLVLIGNRHGGSGA